MGKPFVYDETGAYRLTHHWPGSFELERIADGSTLFFQGDNAAHLEEQLETAARFAACGMLRDLEALDVIADQYDEIMLPPEARR